MHPGGTPLARRDFYDNWQGEPFRPAGAADPGWAGGRKAFSPLGMRSAGPAGGVRPGGAGPLTAGPGVTSGVT